MHLLGYVKKYGIYLVLLLLGVYFSLATDVFLTSNNLFNVLRQISMLGIVAIGVAFVMIAGGMDLSVGSQISFVCMLSAYMMVNMDASPVVAILIGIAATTLT